MISKCRVPYGGTEWEHHGRYDLLPFRPDTMELVPASDGKVPYGRRPVEGGYEENGAKLYHALAVVSGVKVPGKTGEHLVCTLWCMLRHIIYTRDGSTVQMWLSAVKSISCRDTRFCKFTSINR